MSSGVPRRPAGTEERYYSISADVRVTLDRNETWCDRIHRDAGGGSRAQLRLSPIHLRDHVADRPGGLSTTSESI
jgi:hypothetical protein